MKEELEALGFEYDDVWFCYSGNCNIIEVEDGFVWVRNYDLDTIKLFDYNIHKIKILIELLK